MHATDSQASREALSSQSWPKTGAVPEILALGEAMVEFNQTGAGEGRLYLQGFGGDTSNFAIAAARQGARVGLLSALGDDANGRLLRELWDREGVHHRHVRTDASACTAIYFVGHGAHGQSSASFARAPRPAACGLPICLGPAFRRLG
jgi:2-dehydro-3-deoxygluconokinase